MPFEYPDSEFKYIQVEDQGGWIKRIHVLNRCV